MSFPRWKVLGIVLPLILAGVVLSGCIEDEGDEDLEFEGKVYSNLDLVVITVKGGSINWTGKEVQVDNTRLVTSQVSSDDGDEVEFVDTTDSWDAEEGISYWVRIVYSLTSEILWEKNITAEDKNDGNEEEVQTISVKTSIDSTEDIVVLNILKGELNWSIYSVRVDGKSFNTSSGVTKAGGSATFYDPDGTWDAVAGEAYNIKIIHIVENKVLYDADVIAQP